MTALWKDLRTPVRAMLYLHWIYSFVGALTGVFIHIFFYQKFGSVSFNALAQALFFAGVILGFSGCGYIASLVRMNIKYGYPIAFFILGGSFLLLYGAVTKADAGWFMLLNGFGLGVYWLTLHTFELTETQNSERDSYSSLLSACDQVIEFVGPAVATLLLVLSGDVLKWGSYTLLFIVAPVFYLLGMGFLSPIRSYRPEPMVLADFVHALTDHKNQLAQVYMFSGSASYAFSKTAVPIAALVFFGSEKNVGMWNVSFSLFSVVALLVLARFREPENRLRFLLVTSVLFACIYALVAAWYVFAAYLIFSFVSIILKPLQRVSAHVIDLGTMETLGREGSDFFATMVFRDIALGVWRIVSLLLFIVLIHVFGEGEVAVRIGFLFLAGAMLLQYIGAN